MIAALLLFSLFAGAVENNHLTRGIQLLREGRLQEAASELSQAVQEQPQSYQAYFSLGVADAQLGNLANAQAAFRTAVMLNPSSAAAHYNLGMALLQARKTSDGIRELEQAARLAPNNPDIEYNLGTALLEAGKPKQSLPHLQNAAAESSRPEAIAQLARAEMAGGQPEQALGTLDRLPTEIRQSPQALMLRAQAYAGEKNWSQALSTLETISPSPETLLFKSRLYQKLGKPGDALIFLREAAVMDPKSPEIPYSMAFSHYVLGKYDEAAQDLARAIQNDPAMDRAYFLLSIDKLTTGDFAAASTALRKALSLRPQSPFYLCIYGMTLVQDDRNPTAAAAIFRQVIHLAPNYALPHYQLGRILASQGKNAEAASELETAIRLEPAMSEALYHLARVDRLLGRNDAAEHALQRFQSLKRAEMSDQQEMLRSMQEGIGIKSSSSEPVP